MRVAVLRAAIGLACLPVVAGAQTLSLTEAQALSRLSSESPRVQALRAAVTVVEAEILAAARWPNPRLTFSREAVAAVTENYVTVTQPLPITGRRGLEVNAAEARVGAAASRADDQVRRFRADLRLAFTSLWVAQTRERELARGRDRLEALADILGRRETAGESAGFDRLRADREVIDIDADRAAAANEGTRAQGLLAGFFTEAPMTPIEARVEPVSRPPLPAVDELMARAEMRGAFAALGQELEAAQFMARAAGRRAVPEPEVVAGTKSSNAGTGDVGSTVAVHIGVPLFDRGGPERAAAAARAQQVRAETEALRLTVRAQIVAWRAAVLERRQVAEGYRAAVGGNADAIERIAQVSYEAGEQGILELLDAYRTATSARVRQTALDAAVREAEIELEYVSGWELP